MIYYKEFLKIVIIAYLLDPYFLLLPLSHPLHVPLSVSWAEWEASLFSSLKEVPISLHRKSRKSS